jgi:hypothetical protein
MNTTSTDPASWLSRLLKGISAVVFLVGFVTFDYFMFKHEYVLAVAVLAASLLSAPFIIADSWRARFSGVLVMLVVFLSLLAGSAAYFALFSLQWFERVFNNKASGPLGLAIFLFVFAGIGGYVGYGCVRLIARWSGPSRQEQMEAKGDISVS